MNGSSSDIYRYISVYNIDFIEMNNYFTHWIMDGIREKHIVHGFSLI